MTETQSSAAELMALGGAEAVSKYLEDHPDETPRIQQEMGSMSLLGGGKAAGNSRDSAYPNSTKERQAARRRKLFAGMDETIGSINSRSRANTLEAYTKDVTSPPSEAKKEALRRRAAQQASALRIQATTRGRLARQDVRMLQTADAALQAKLQEGLSLLDGGDEEAASRYLVDLCQREPDAEAALLQVVQAEEMEAKRATKVELSLEELVCMYNGVVPTGLVKPGSPNEPRLGLSSSGVEVAWKLLDMSSST